MYKTTYHPFLSCTTKNSPNSPVLLNAHFSIILPSTHAGLLKGLLPSGYPIKLCTFCLQCMLHDPPILIILILYNQYYYAPSHNATFHGLLSFSLSLVQHSPVPSIPVYNPCRVLRYPQSVSCMRRTVSEAYEQLVQQHSLFPDGTLNDKRLLNKW